MTQNPATEDPNLEAGADAPEQAATAEAGLDAQLAKLQAERDDLKDKLLRTLAEMENLRRRTEREIADAKAYAVTSFARDMLGSSDNLRRALESVPADAMKAADAATRQDGDFAAEGGAAGAGRERGRAWARRRTESYPPALPFFVRPGCTIWPRPLHAAPVPF